MIISASRRTDIPAFYAEWMVRRLKEGYCTVANPLNRNQVTRISLKPEDVDAIVFWTRNPRPLMAHLDELDSRGYRYYFQFTILGYPGELDPRCPPAATAAETFRELAERLGPQRVIWRYDPIVFTGITPRKFHEENFGRLAELLRGHTRRAVISIVDMYRKTEARLKELEGTAAAVRPCDVEDLAGLMRKLAKTAGENGIEIVSCAEEIDLRPFGILSGKCVDDRVIAEAFGIEVPKTKDPTQRAACGCVVSRDIGMYESCLFGCQYCYATKSFDQAAVNYKSHNPNSPSLLGWHEPPERVPGGNDEGSW
jgi:hypothetical protein